AASGVATRRLANPEARIVGLMGTGFQAETQLEAVAKVRRLSEVRVYSRSEANRRQFAERMSESLGLPINPVPSPEEGIRGCHIAITATAARQPVLLGDWLSPGMHINAIGSNQARNRELDAMAVGRASLIVADSIEQAKMESGDLIAAFEQGQGNWDQVVELADVISSRHPGRRTPEEITLFKSNGVALEDIAVAGYIYEQAIANLGS
ncbi:MAG: ornithine cyclodeaminase family protein, partial [Acidobacteria bacterium]|nr:ornithine cyclodeaminase family protein [Acidobacteriota bacterium]